MPFSLITTISLGSGQAGLTLEAQLIDANGSEVGSPITSGFTEIGNGNYLWNYQNYPDGFQGAVVFSSADVIKAVADINPPTNVTDDVSNIEIEDNMNLKQSLAVILSVLAGRVVGATSDTITFYAAAGESQPRVIAKLDGRGNRVEVDLNLPS